MKEDIRKHCKTCATCQLHKLENMKFERKIFKPSLQPMDIICMDLIGEFLPPTSHGHHYALTAVCMLTGFTWCVPVKTKTAEEVSKAYLDHIYSNFGGSIKIIQTTEQWEDRRIPQVPENMYWQEHHLQIGVGQAHTDGNSML